MSYQSSQLLGWCWFTQRGNSICIVLCQSRKEQRYSYRAYIAVVNGGSKAIDALYTANCGAKFPVFSAVDLIKTSGEINQLSFHDKTLLTETFLTDGKDAQSKG